MFSSNFEIGERNFSFGARKYATLFLHARRHVATGLFASASASTAAAADVAAQRYVALRMPKFVCAKTKETARVNERLRLRLCWLGTWVTRRALGQGQGLALCVCVRARAR